MYADVLVRSFKKEIHVSRRAIISTGNSFCFSPFLFPPMRTLLQNSENGITERYRASSHLSTPMVISTYDFIAEVQVRAKVEI